MTGPSVSSPSKRSPLPAARVLIVEDEALLAADLHDRLEALGYEVAGLAGTADEAITRAVATRPDVVLMDVRLRGQRDGIEAAAAIMAQVDTAIIFLTAHADNATLARAETVAPYGYLVKPVFERPLGAALKVALHRHALERRLRESEERFEATLVSLGEGVIAADSTGRVTFINPVASRLTGIPRAEATTLSADQVLRLATGPERTPMPSPMRHVANEGVRRLGAETWLLGRHGAARPIEGLVTPIRTLRGEPIGAVAVFRDVYDRLQSEQALARARERLRKTETLDAVGRLAGGVAHDVNNMMTVVTGYADLMLSGHLTPEFRAMIEQIGAAAARSSDLTRQLLAFARQQMLRPVSIDLDALITRVEPSLRARAGTQVDLILSVRPRLWRIRADAEQVEQVLLGLVDNACDAMPEGGRLVIEARNVSIGALSAEAGDITPGDYVRLAVSDTGAGMDARTLARIFEPFFTTKPQGEGVGLGLATIHGVVRQSGGQITVDSAPGAGTIFRIDLPRAAYPKGSDEV